MMVIFIKIMVALIVLVASHMFTYRLGKRRGYNSGALKVIGEWKRYLNQMEE